MLPEVEATKARDDSSMQSEKQLEEQPKVISDLSTQSASNAALTPGLPPVPDGGLQAWLTIAGATLVLFCTFGLVQAYGVFQDYYTRVSLTDKTPSDVSWVGSLQVCLLFALGIPAGTLFDLGYFKILLFLGSLLHVFSIFMTSLTKPHHYYQTVLAQGIGQGIGMGIIYLPAVSIVSHYFRRRRSLAYSIVISGTAVGGIIWPILLNHLFVERAGFAWGVRALGFIVLGSLICANLMMKTRLPRRQDRPDYQKPDIKSVLSDVPYLITVFGSALIFWGLLFPFFYLQFFAAVHGIDENITLNIIPIMNGAAIFGRVIPGFAADYVGPFNIVIVFTTISGGLIFAMFGATSNASVVVFAILYGFFSGAFVGLIASIAAVFATSLNEIGIRVGFACFVISFFLLTGEPISGALIGSLNPADAALLTWWKAIVFNGIVVLIGCVFVAVGRSYVAKRKGSPLV